MSGIYAGWPFVTPDDYPVDFPVHSEELAHKLAVVSAEVIYQPNYTGSTAVYSAGDICTFVMDITVHVLTNPGIGMVTIPPGHTPFVPITLVAYDLGPNVPVLINIDPGGNLYSAVASLAVGDRILGSGTWAIKYGGA